MQTIREVGRSYNLRERDICEAIGKHQKHFSESLSRAQDAVARQKILNHYALLCLGLTVRKLNNVA